MTETWLTSDTLNDDADLRIENYTFYRKDRNNGNSRGGGVGFFIADNLIAKCALICHQITWNFYGSKSRQTKNEY